MARLELLAGVLLTHNTQFHCQFPGFSGFDSGTSNPFAGNNPGPPQVPGTDGGDSPFAISNRAGHDAFVQVVFGHSRIIAHGVLASLALVIFFPFGAISIRLLPSRLALPVHIAFQTLGYLMLVAAFGLGLWMALQINFSDFKLINQAHPVMGIIVFSFLSLQPVLGVLHHVLFKEHDRRTFWTFAHLWIGRLFITLGIINGGLGLRLARNASMGEEIAYGVIAAVIWLVWMGAVVHSEMRQIRAPPAYQRQVSPRQSMRRQWPVYV